MNLKMKTNQDCYVSFNQSRKKTAANSEVRAFRKRNERAWIASLKCLKKET